MIATTTKIIRALRQLGLRETIVLSIREISRKRKEYFSLDRINGIDTNGYIPLEKLNIASTNWHSGTQYQPSPTKLFTRILHDIKIRHEDYVFVDFGSGKGRALLLASNLPFKKVIGVEFSPELHAISIQNITKYRNRKQKCLHVEALCIDAVDFEIPPESCVFYFFNPFDREIMRIVLSNIKDLMDRTSRDDFFIYYNPVHGHLFEEFGFPKSRVRLIDIEIGPQETL